MIQKTTMNGAFWLCVGLTVFCLVVKSSDAGPPFLAAVSNLPLSTKVHTLQALFEEAVGAENVLDVNLLRDERSGVSRGLAIVQLKDALSLGYAVEVLDQKELYGRTIRVHEANH